MLFEENLIFRESVSSTNEVLFRSSLAEFPFHTSLLAKTQWAGRGRASRRWLSESGGLYISTLLRPQRAEGLSIFGALVVATLCREQYGVEAMIRWPNDVTVEGKKLAGVLPQLKFQGARIERAVLGVGLNISQSFEAASFELAESVTTLTRLTGRVFDLPTVARAYLCLLQKEWDRFESAGRDELYRRAEAWLEASGTDLVAVVASEDGSFKRLGRITGLGRGGELCFEDGSTLSHLGVQERLRFSPPHRPTVSS